LHGATTLFNLSRTLVGRLVTCGRLAIGLTVALQQQAD
jgi:hypothetical protein